MEHTMSRSDRCTLCTTDRPRRPAVRRVGMGPIPVLLGRKLVAVRVWQANNGMTSLQVGVAVALVLGLLFLVAFLLRHEDANWFRSAFERKVQKLHLIQTLRRDLLASAEAEK